MAKLAYAMAGQWNVIARKRSKYTPLIYNKNGIGEQWGKYGLFSN